MKRLPLIASMLAILAVFALVLWFGVFGKPPIYRATISQAESPGSVLVVFYGKRYDEYTSSGQLIVPKVGWKITRLPGSPDTVRLEPESKAEPLRFETSTQPVLVSLIRHANGGVAKLEGAPGFTRQFNLRSPQETIENIQIGGPESTVPPTTEIFGFKPVYAIAIGLLVLVILVALAFRIAKR
ncbi:hypothetical protein LZ009_22750 [Ramlibacter sp. XY19]|uniref:hypothetical protein n=1 Tax=Ramlibacter paludis TaxID=2908000 RepID=UPI0023DCC9A1|nr:hypothetical protein [Ramlibacter paludis]MCG2595607.1 hypothetical protein [Ramlibacter paludis]